MTVDPRTTALFRRILVSGIALVLVGVLVSIIVHRTAYEMASEQVRAGQLSALRLSAHTMDLLFEEIDSIARRISSNKRFVSLVSSQRTDRFVRPIRTYEVWDELRFDLINSHVISDAYLVVPHLDVVISPDRIVINPARHYGALYGSPRISLDEWHRVVLRPGTQIVPSTEWVTESRPIRGPAYIRSYPLDHESVSVASMLFIVSESTIRELLDTGPVAPSFSAVLSDAGTLVVGFGDDRALEALRGTFDVSLLESTNGSTDLVVSGARLIVSHQRSSRGNLVYVVGVPVASVYARIRWVRTVALGVIVLYGAAGLAGAILLARTNTRPFTELVAANVRLATIIDESKPHLRASFLNRLLHGGFDTEDELEPLLEDLALPRSAIGYRLIAVRLGAGHGGQSRSAVTAARTRRVAYLDRLKGALSYSDIAFSFGDEAVYLLHALRRGDVEDDSVVLDAAMTLLGQSRAIGLSASIGVGNPVRSLVDIKRSLDQALEALEFGEYTGATLPILYRSLPTSVEESYYYPTDLAIRLENAVRAGSPETVELTLAEVRRRNFGAEPLSAGMARQLLYDLRGTYVRAIGGRARSSAVPELDEGADALFGPAYEAKPPEFETLVEAFTAAAEAIGRRKRSHHDALRERIVRFVDDNVTNPNLSVALVASENDLSEDYLSRFFHEQVGETFSHYVETRRVDRAAELLSATDLTVEAVAADCGFGSVRTLRRTLQRRKGVSPTDIRVPSARRER